MPSWDLRDLLWTDRVRCFEYVFSDDDNDGYWMLPNSSIGDTTRHFATKEEAAQNYIDDYNVQAAPYNGVATIVGYTAIPPNSNWNGFPPGTIFLKGEYYQADFLPPVQEFVSPLLHYPLPPGYE